MVKVKVKLLATATLTTALVAGAVPAAFSAESGIPTVPEMTRVTLAIQPGDLVRAEETVPVNGVDVFRNACWAPRLSAPSDPRLSGELTYCADGERYGDDVVEHQWYRIANAEGVWQGSTISYLPNGEFGGPNSVVLAGEGAYEGLYAWLDVGSWADVSGVIFNWSPPEAPIPLSSE